MSGETYDCCVERVEWLSSSDEALQELLNSRGGGGWRLAQLDVQSGFTIFEVARLFRMWPITESALRVSSVISRKRPPNRLVRRTRAIEPNRGVPSYRTARIRYRSSWPTSVRSAMTARRRFQSTELGTPIKSNPSRVSTLRSRPSCGPVDRD